MCVVAREGARRMEAPHGVAQERNSVVVLSGLERRADGVFLSAPEAKKGARAQPVRNKARDSSIHVEQA